MEIGIADAKERAQPPIDCKLNFNQMSTKCYGWGTNPTLNLILIKCQQNVTISTLNKILI